MANDVPITPGVGSSIATYDEGGRQVQQIGQYLEKVSQLTEIAINCALNGDNTIVALTAAQTIRLYGFFLMAGAAVNVKWKDGTAGTDFHPALALLGNGAAWMLPRDGRPWFTTTAGLALVLNLSGAFQVSGRAYYTKS